MKILKQQLNEIIRFFKQMIPDRKKHLYKAFFAGLSGMFFNLLLAYMLRNIYIAVTANNSSLLFNYISFFILFLAGAFLYNCIWWTIYTNSTAKLTGDLRKITFSKLCSLQLYNVDGFHSGEIMTMFTNDLDEAKTMYINIRLYISSFLLGLVSTILVLYISSYLGLLIVAFGILQVFINFLVIKPLEKQSIKIREEMQKINSHFSDIMNNNLTIKLYCSEDFYIKTGRVINKKLYKTKMKLNIINAVINSVNIFFGLLGYIASLIIGCYLISEGKLTIPDLLFVTQMRNMMIQGILTFSNFAVQIQPAIVGVRKIMGFMEYEEEEDAVGGSEAIIKQITDI